MKSTAQASSAGKIIVSGEHSVVFGAPALAMPISLKAHSRIEKTAEKVIKIDLPQLGISDELPVKNLKNLAVKLDENHNLYLNNSCEVKNITSSPCDIFFYVVEKFYEQTGIIEREGLSIEITSEIRPGAGMGSSAATSASLARALMEYYDVSLTDNELFELTRHVERLQHGKSSGIDPATTVRNQPIRYQALKIEPRSFSLSKDWKLVFTGTPESSTGECVSKVRQNIGETNFIWQKFARVTEEVQSALESQNDKDLRSLVRLNHQLLCDIGVVPKRVVSFIDELESEYEGVAKICGAGAVRGENAGVLLVHAKKPIEPLCEKYGYQVLSV